MVAAIVTTSSSERQKSSLRCGQSLNLEDIDDLTKYMLGWGVMAFPLGVFVLWTHSRLTSTPAMAMTGKVILLIGPK